MNHTLHRWYLALALIMAVMLHARGLLANDSSFVFTQADRAFLAQFSLDKVGPLPDAADNRYADNPDAAALGQQLFFDKRLSHNKQIACNTCHEPSQFFSDGRKVSEGIGQTRRNAPSIPNALRGPWQYWDGRRDSLWSQALVPIEHPDEQGFSRLDVVAVIAQHYLQSYEALFGPISPNLELLAYVRPASPLGDVKAQANWQKIDPAHQQTINLIFANVGKAIMAYERRLTLSMSRFDQFLAALLQHPNDLTALKQLYSADEVEGLRLFMGRGNCASCHNGPMLTNFEFHNVGVPEANPDAVDLGRYAATDALVDDTFNCLSKFSDAEPDLCNELRFLKRQGPELVGAFKTPSLRNVARTAPYMHAGQFATLDQVVEHYSTPTPPFYDRAQHPSRPHFDLLPLQLSPSQKAQLVSFLKTLTSDPSQLDERWWRDPSVANRQ